MSRDFNSSQQQCSVSLGQILAKNEPKAVEILVDGSGSVDEGDFNGPLKRAVKSIVYKFNENDSAQTITTIRQFSIDTKIEAEGIPKERVQEAISAIEGMKRMAQLTHTSKAVQAAIASLQTYPKNYDKTILIITDGNPTTGYEPYEDIKMAGDLGIKVVAMGIGQGIIEENLSKMSTDGMHFSVRNYRNFLHVIENASTTVQDIKLDVSLLPSSKNMEMEKGVELVLGLKNRRADGVLEGPFRIRIEKDEYWLDSEVIHTGSLKGGESALVDLRLEKRSDANADAYPGMVKFIVTCTSSTNGFQQSGFAILGTGFLRGEFERDVPIPINCLMFGNRGSGKSQFINSLITCLSMNTIPCKQIHAARDSTHVTRNYGKIWVADKIRDKNEKSSLLSAEALRALKADREKIRIAMYDIWGIEGNNFDVLKVSHLLNGQLPPGTNMDKASQSLTERKLKDLIHVCIFVCPLSSGEDPEAMKQLNEKIAQVNQFTVSKVPCLLIVTFIDDIEQEDLRNEKFAKLVDQVQGIPPTLVFPHKNYHLETERDVKIDLSTLKIMRAIRELGDTWVENNGGVELYEDVDWDCSTILNEADSALLKDRREQRRKKEEQQQQQMPMYYQQLPPHQMYYGQQPFSPHPMYYQQQPPSPQYSPYMSGQAPYPGSPYGYPPGMPQQPQQQQQPQQPGYPYGIAPAPSPMSQPVQETPSTPPPSSSSQGVALLFASGTRVKPVTVIDGEDIWPKLSKSLGSQFSSATHHFTNENDEPLASLQGLPPRFKVKIVASATPAASPAANANASGKVVTVKYGQRSKKFMLQPGDTHEILWNKCKEWHSALAQNHELCHMNGEGVLDEEIVSDREYLVQSF